MIIQINRAPLWERIKLAYFLVCGYPVRIKAEHWNWSVET